MISSIATFPQYACDYARNLAARSPRFALQIDAAPEFEKENIALENKTAYSADPFGEFSSSSKCHGLRQRFQDRVLVMVSTRCFMNCRHCTRRALLGKSEVVETDSQLASCLDYVKAHSEIRDILLSGGDALTLSDEKILKFADSFSALEQIDIVRVCTRALAANPSRITKELASNLGRSKKVWVNTQFNCADEVTDEARNAAGILVDAGIPVSCQTVLLKGVNDSSEEMLKLFRALSAARIRPYYVFTCDPIAGIERFRVPLETAKRIERECAESIGGLSLPRFVSDIPGAKRKIPISEL
ncbi:MAG: KamA family radical SAM protein [Kiritimatiellae bacterium]|nr:KamA family radical SAM protein [Kiritimatiellia bacterium]